MVFITSSPPKPGQSKTARILRFCVSARRRNDQFGFSTGTELAPDLESTPDEFGPFPHTTQAPMSGDVVLTENDWVDALSVIANSHLQAVFTVSDVYLDSSGICVTDRISQGLHTNPIHLVTNDGIEGPRRSLNMNTQLGTRFSCGAAQEVLAEFA